MKYADTPFTDDQALETCSRQLIATREAWIQSTNTWLDGPDYVDTHRLRSERLDQDCKALERQICEARALGLKGLALQSRMMLLLLYRGTPVDDPRILSLSENLTFRLEELAGKEGHGHE